MEGVTLHDLNNLVGPDQIKKHFPHLPQPKRITVLETVDHNGEEAYDVVIVYPDNSSASDKALEKGRIAPMIKWIREQILAHREGNRWPYLWFRRESEDRTP
jgi:hypothetical protein